MLYTVIDSDQKKVIDVVAHGDETRYIQEYTELYEAITGQKVEFKSIEEAKGSCVEAVHNRTFNRPVATRTKDYLSSTAEVYRPPWLNADGTPTATPPEGAETAYSNRKKDGPLARARVIFEEMWGSPRKDIIEACAKAGIKRSTAATQYQAFKKMKESELTVGPNGMPQLPPGVQVGNQSES